MAIYGQFAQLVRSACLLAPTAILLSCLMSGCNNREKGDASATAGVDSAQPTINHSNADKEHLSGSQSFARLNEQEIQQLRPSVTAFCADCHPMPRPTSSSVADWKEEVEQGFMLYETSGRKDLSVPDEAKTLAFFQSQANSELDWSASQEPYPDCTVAFTKSRVRLASQRPPAITNVRWIGIGLHDSKALVYCDITSGGVVAHWPLVKSKPTKRLGTLLQPVHIEPCDLNGDGNIDLIAADIGEFNADDSDLGRVVWLKRKPDSESFQKIVLLDGLSRVSDVQPDDFDGDGDIDLLVGAFGWRNSGRIFLMVNEGESKGHDDGRPVFSIREIDPRHGAVHVPTIDLNDDGKMDFIALISQEHEVVEAFINDGAGNFRREVIYQAPDPAYGSSGIQLVDMDGDGDRDVLYTNGDSFDRGPKPYHSVQWLENTGGYPYKHHHLCVLPGVLCAKADDFDGDGDVDVVAGALLGKTAIGHDSALDTSSLVYIEQVKPGEFETTSIEAKQHVHLALETGDFNNDGKPDIAVGQFLRASVPDKSDLVIYQSP